MAGGNRGSGGGGGRGGAKARRASRVRGANRGVAGVLMTGGRMAARGGSSNRGFVYRF